MQMKQQDLKESVERNRQERIKHLREDGDGYMTVVTDDELKEILKKMEARRDKKCQSKKH